MAVLNDTLCIDRNVFRRYAGLSLPRHVSYPMPGSWRALDAVEARPMLRESNAQIPGHDLSIYLHIPFCERLCKFCACNRVIQRKEAAGAEERTERYVMAIRAELRRLAGRMDGARLVRQIHYGGGSPTYLTPEQIERIHNELTSRFEVAHDGETAMEIDPRYVTLEQLRCLRRLGFNRLSMGVQDFDEQVQQHVRRVQSFELVRDVVTTCRDLGFESINFDLIYGMPYQTPETIRDTVEQTIGLKPDRIAYYHYAQVPEKVATQRGIDHTKLPDSEAKLEMFLIGLELFGQAGYEFIGLDHFARPDEPLAAALRNGSIQRNFQGMTTGAGLRLIGVGASSISQLPDVGFLQNIKDTEAYMACIEHGDSPVERGTRLTFDDRVRQAVINELYCTARLEPSGIEARFGICFGDYFAQEVHALHELEVDGLVRFEGDGAIAVTCPLGRVLMRNVAAVFDAYLDPEAWRKGEKTCFSTNV